MIPWYWFVLNTVVCFILSYAFHGTFKAVVRKIQSPLYTHLGDIRTQLNTVITDTNSDAILLRSKLQPILARIEKVLP